MERNDCIRIVMKTFIENRREKSSLTLTLMRSTSNIFRRGIGGELAPTFWILFADKLAMVTEIILFFQLNIRWDIDYIRGINSDWTWQSREKGLNKNPQIQLLLYLNTCMVFFNSTLVLERLQRFWPIMGNWWTQTQLGENLNLRHTFHQTFFLNCAFDFKAEKSDNLTINPDMGVENAKFESRKKFQTVPMKKFLIPASTHIVDLREDRWSSVE